MNFENRYVQTVMNKVREKYYYEPEFIQSVEEVLKSLESIISKHPEYEKANLIERMVEPERIFKFRVCWTDDDGNVKVNTGYRVQFNGAIGPYKGGLRFHPSVYMGIMKFLAFEQTFKNSLTGLPIGGGKGGSDFDPRGKSDAEIMRFCQAFMTELCKYIGPNMDIPAGDLGVGGKEIGFLFGQFKRIKSSFENGVLTGKGLSYGGSLIRPEATGYGAVYFAREVLNHFNETFNGKTIALSGFGNVAWGVASKVTSLGGKVVTISGPDGFIYDEKGLGKEKINYMLKMRASGRDCVKDFADKFGVVFVEGKKPWGVKVDICMPCATQNEIDVTEAKKIVANGVRYLFEVSNMPATNPAIRYLQDQGVTVAPSKAVNAGGVACSALEMSQNSIRYNWSAEEVEAKLERIMVSIYKNSVNAALEEGLGYNLVAGANIAGFKRVADAMMAEGVI